jgi:hypothetical protein
MPMMEGNNQDYELVWNESDEYGDWLEDFRKKDKDNWKPMKIDFSNHELSIIKKAAEALGMNEEEYINYALFIAVSNMKDSMIHDPNLVCNTCEKYRRNNAEPCPQCGEMDF